MDVEHIERVESELDQLVERRARQAKDADEEHDLWKAGVERYNGARRQKNREAWRTFHHKQAEAIERTAAELVANHRAQAKKYMSVDDLPKGA